MPYVSQLSRCMLPQVKRTSQVLSTGREGQKARQVHMATEPGTEPKGKYRFSERLLPARLANVSQLSRCLLPQVKRTSQVLSTDREGQKTRGGRARRRRGEGALCIAVVTVYVTTGKASFTSAFDRSRGTRGKASTLGDGTQRQLHMATVATEPGAESRGKYTNPEGALNVSSYQCIAVVTIVAATLTYGSNARTFDREGQRCVDERLDH